MQEAVVELGQDSLGAVGLRTNSICWVKAAVTDGHGFCSLLLRWWWCWLMHQRGGAAGGRTARMGGSLGTKADHLVSGSVGVCLCVFVGHGAGAGMLGSVLTHAILLRLVPCCWW